MRYANFIMKLRLPLGLLVVSHVCYAGTLPHDVVALKSKRDEKVSEIDLAYIAELRKLQTKYTKEGNLETANDIEAVIKKTLGPDPFAEMDAEKAKAEAEKTVTKYTWGSGGTLTLFGTGKAKHTSWDKEGTWRKTEDGTILLEAGTGGAFKITFDNEGVGQVKSLKNGASTTITKKD